jgi:hypothetical protein
LKDIFRNIPERVNPIQMYLIAVCWWLTPIILATREAESRKMVVQGESRQTVHKLPSLK